MLGLFDADPPFAVILELLDVGDVVGDAQSLPVDDGYALNVLVLL